MANWPLPSLLGVLGVLCLVGDVAGGDLKFFGIELPAVHSVRANNPYLCWGPL